MYGSMDGELTWQDYGMNWDYGLLSRYDSRLDSFATSLLVVTYGKAEAGISLIDLMWKPTVLFMIFSSMFCLPDDQNHRAVT